MRLLLVILLLIGCTRPVDPVLPHEELQQDYTARAPFYIYYTDWIDHALHKWWQYPEQTPYLLEVPK